MTISAKIIAHSKSSVTGKEIITYELNYPRFIHSELMTHRLFSRNAASSRAIPVAKMIEMVRENPAAPIHYGKNQPGMQAKEELTGCDLDATKSDWITAAKAAASIADRMVGYGAHKQIVNRILEPFQWMKTVVTSTEWDNWYWLRNHPDAQPEIKRLAEVMWEAKENSVPFNLSFNEWHVPYVDRTRSETQDVDGFYEIQYWSNGVKLSEEEAIVVSASCCAQVSYRKLDDSLEKAKDIFAKLIESKPCHASPCEHQAKPMIIHRPTSLGYNAVQKDWLNIEEGFEQQGITHMDNHGNLWSGNFQGFVQHRQLIPDNACWNYSPEGDKE